MRFKGTILKVKNTSFAIVVVPKQIYDDNEAAIKAITTYRPVFHDIPILLMAQDETGKAFYFGRSDLVRYMSTIPLEKIPWKEYILA